MSIPRLRSVARLSIATWTVAALVVGPVRATAQAQDAAPPPARAAANDAAPRAEGAAPAPAQEPKRILYVPESFKVELREELKREILEQAKREGWAAPGVVPSWLQRLHVNGDVRVRWERDLFERGSSAGEPAFIDFAAINSGKPLDVNFVDLSTEKYLNADQDRNRARLRARLGVDADVAKGFTAGVRLATGESSSPVSENQTLGGSPGNFSKYQVWLDRAFVQYETPGLMLRFGRFENPFFSIGKDLVWHDDLNFDGAVVRGSGPIGGGLTPLVTVGAFPVYSSTFAFPAEQPTKFKSFDKWLYAGQVGSDWKATNWLTVKAGAAFYYFDELQGKASSPCDTNLSYVSCDTDERRPAFAQKGNTYMPLRTPSDQALLAFAANPATPEYQFFGLAARFREISATARVEAKLSPRLTTTLSGEWVRNLGFSQKQIDAVAVNNLGTCPVDQAHCAFVGGDTGYLGRVSFGSGSQLRQWDWDVSLAYRHLESDAVVDAFTDSDFGLGGTNLKGYIVEGGLGLADGIWSSVRWMSANEIAGSPYRVDVLQVDLLARF